jgi:predicted DNA repair protein MutK
MDRLRANWKWLLLVTVVAFFAIAAFEPDYTKLQTASDADEFRRVLGDNKGGAIGANLSDVVFALGYGLLGVLAFRAVDTTRRGLVGAALIGGGAVADEIENALVFRNLVGSDDTTDAWIDAMRAVGTVKTTLLLLALGAFAGAVIVRAVRNRRDSAGS